MCDPTNWPTGGGGRHLMFVPKKPDHIGGIWGDEERSACIAVLETLLQ